MSARPIPDLDSVLRLRGSVRYRLLDGEAVVVLQREAEVLGLNEVGSRLLTLLDGRTTLGGAIERLAAEYVVDRAILQREMLAFAADLIAHGVTEAVPPAADAEPGAR